MPRVPVSDGPSVKTEALRPVFQSTPDVSSGLQGLAGGIEQIAQVADRRAQRDAADEAFRIETQVKADWLAVDAELRKRYRGDNTKGYLEEVDAWWAKAAQTHGEKASPLAKRLVDRSLGAFSSNAKANALGYYEGEREKAIDANYAARQATTIQAGVADLSPVNVGERSALAVRDIDEGVRAYAAVKGWNSERTAAELLQARSKYHTEVVQVLANKSPAKAAEYLQTHRKDIDGRAFAQLESRIKDVADAAEAFGAADAIIQQAGGLVDGKPVELDKLEAAARERFAADPGKARAAIVEIRSRVQAFQTAENERKAGNVAAVMGAFQQGASLATLRAMREFAALPGDVRAQIEDRVLATQQARAGYDLTNLQRAQARLAMQGASAYLVYSNPETLANMSEADIINLSPLLGNDLTGRLMDKRRALQNKDARLEATIDEQEFNDAAQRMGLRPFDPKKNEEERAALGDVKLRIERLIDRAQQAKKAPLTREEKRALIDGEMARTVKVKGWFSDSTKPVIALTGKDVEKVEVPKSDAAAITKALQRAYEQTKDPNDAPTEANVRRIYLRSKSLAAESLPTPTE